MTAFFARHKALMWEDDMKLIGDTLLLAKISEALPSRALFTEKKKSTSLLWTALCLPNKKKGKKIFKFISDSFSFTHSPMNRKS